MYLHLIDKQAAIKAGLKHYFIGRACARSGLMANRAMSGKCKCIECASAHREAVKARYKESIEEFRESRRKKYHMDKSVAKSNNAASHARHRHERLEKMKQYRLENLSSEKNRKNKYREENAEAIKKRAAEKYLTSRDYHLARMREYREKNPELILSYCAKRRAAKRDRIPSWFSDFDSFVFAECISLAAYREQSTGIKWHVDHCIPMQARDASGLHCGQNLQVIPASINISKGRKMIYTEPFEWMRSV